MPHILWDTPRGHILSGFYTDPEAKRELEGDTDGWEGTVVPCKWEPCTCLTHDYPGEVHPAYRLSNYSPPAR